MDCPATKGALPFKTMDIKDAFQKKMSSQARKRKASASDDLKTDSKALKLSSNHEVDELGSNHKVEDKLSSNHEVEEKLSSNHEVGKKLNSNHEVEEKLNSNHEVEDDIEIIEEVKSSKVPIDSLENGLSDSKQNTDLNIGDEKVNGSQLQCNSKVATKSPSSENFKHITDSSVIDTSKLSSDELDSSVMDSSALNSTLNISASAVSDDQSEDSAKKEASVDTSVKKASEQSEKKIRSSRKNVKETENEEGPKKKKRMSPEEAKLKAEEREKKQQEKEAKKKELEAKKKELEAKKTQKLLEKEQKQKERERISREKQMRKEEEEKEKKEKERLKQEKKEQEEKEKQERIKEREWKNKVKQMTIDAKLEEKRRKEEEKQKALEEKKKAEEEKKRKETEKEQKEREKKEKAKANFFSFFVKNKPSPAQPVSQPTEKEGGFLPFQVSGDMILAPVVPAVAQERFNKGQLDNSLKHQGGKELYLQNLRSGSYRSVKQNKKVKEVPSCEAEEVILIDTSEQASLGLRAKLFQFCENVRPPYWGTWRKTSKTVQPRNPFKQDEIFDYSVDSDDEWDEGGPGESLSGTEDEEKESDDEYEVDNEFFVPHGYLSAEEEEEEDGTSSNDPEQQKALLKIKLQEFERERKKKTTELKPIILGCYIENDTSSKDNGLVKFLESYAAEFLSDAPILTTFSILQQQAESKPSAANSTDASSPVSDGSAVKQHRGCKSVPEEAMPFLIRLLHANTNGRVIVVKEFQEFWKRHCQQNASPHLSENASPRLKPSESITVCPQTPGATENGGTKRISKRQLDLTIQKISNYGRCPTQVLRKFCWWVNDDVREKYGLSDAPVPNVWEYVSKKDTDEESPALAKSPAVSSIKQFLHP